MSLVVDRIGQQNRQTIANFTDQSGQQPETFTLSTDVPNLLDSEDDICSGCRNVSQCHLKQSFSGLHSPR